MPRSDSVLWRTGIVSTNDKDIVPPFSIVPATQDGELVLRSSSLVTRGLNLSKILVRDRTQLLQAAEQGDASAQYDLGVMYAEGHGVPQDYAEAATWYQKAADQGHADAQINLGDMYCDGKGVSQDYAEAFKWFRKAAEQGDGVAQDFLGYMYDFGLGVPQDYAEAFKWWRMAAEQGHADAQDNLGHMCASGRGVPQDYVQSYFWYSLAASRSSGEDHKKCSDARDLAAKELAPEKLMEAQRMVREWEKSHPRK